MGESEHVYTYSCIYHRTCAYSWAPLILGEKCWVCFPRYVVSNCLLGTSTPSQMELNGRDVN